jgi:hypothetical protein
MPFLTDLDERAQVKGSRDPLGVIPIWAKFGREVVGNLTTASGNVRGFTTLLIGLELAEMLRERMRGEAPALLPLFLRFEQIAGYARVKVHGDREVRGYRRVKQRLEEQKRIRVSAEAADQILSSQKAYGLWGLYSVPARASELLEPGSQRLTPQAREFVQRHYFPMLGGELRTLLDLVRRDWFGFEPEGRHRELKNALGKMHSRDLRKDERAFYREHLSCGGPVDPTGGRQPALASILEDLDTSEFGLTEFREVRKQAQKNGSLADSLARIDAVERLIAPAGALFGFLQLRDGQAVSSVVGEIGREWRRPLDVDVEAIRSVRPTLASATGSNEMADLWVLLAEALAAGDYGAVFGLLVRINTSVMQRRNGAAAWIAVEQAKIRVRMADAPANLISVDEAERMWKSTFFINSLWSVARRCAAR